jgi:hypothetical protein
MDTRHVIAYLLIALIIVGPILITILLKRWRKADHRRDSRHRI